MGSDQLRSHPVFGPLRRMKGVAFLMVDDEHKVAIPKAGNRWRKLADIIEEMDWSAMKAYDGEGTLLGIVRNPEESADVADEDEPDRPVTLTQLANVLVAVQSKTMQETRQMFQAQMDGYGRIIEGMAEANRTIADSYSLALRVSTAATAANAAGEGGASEVMDMLKLAMPMMVMSRQQQQQQPLQRPTVQVPAVQVRRPPRIVPTAPAAPRAPQPEVKPDGE